VPAGVFATASAHHIALLAVVSNFGKNGFMASIAKAVLTPGTVQTAAINNMVGIAGRGFAGINVDFESVPHTLRPQYTAFAQALATALHKAGSTLVLSLPATTVDNPNDSWTGAYDYAALAKIADTLQVMTYDENGPWGPPGPVAGLDWVTACLAYSQTVVPAAKISLGMPAYGYDWDTTQGTGVQVSYKAIPALLRATGAKAQWNAATSSPWFTYQASNGDAHTVWYENARSIQIKAALASAKNVASVSVYALGFDNAAFWQAVQAGLAAPYTKLP
jgi:spore germination protein YaaH